MFKLFAKKKQESSNVPTSTIHINDSVVRTKDNQILRCVDINAEFTYDDTAETKASEFYEIVRNSIRDIAYKCCSEDIQKEICVWVKMIHEQIKQYLSDVNVHCTSLTINTIEKL